MKKWGIFLSLLFWVQWAFSQSLDPSKIVFGFIPGGSPVETEQAAKTMTAHLKKTLGIEVQYVISNNYGEMIDAISNNKVDFAFLTAMTYVLSEKKSSVKVLLKKVWEGPYYHSVVLVKNQKIKELKDLKGKRVAFVDIKSASGYLYPSVALKKLKLSEKDFAKVVFSGSHEKSVQMLVNDEVDAIATFSDDIKGPSSSWLKYSGGVKVKSHVIWASEPIPNDPLVVRKTFYEAQPKLTHNLMFSLIELIDEKKNEPSIKNYFGANSLMLATSRQYDPVREMVNELNPVIE
jgi:phosphonate transport system substrate-binding protein